MRKAVFDIQIVPQRKNPFNTNTHNQLVMQLYQAGAFTAQMADSTIVALDAMIMDNKDRIIKSLRELKAQQLQEQMLQMQMLGARQMAQMPADTALQPAEGGGGVM